MLNGKLKKQVMPAVVACVAVLAILLVAFQMVSRHEQANALSQVIAGAWYTTYPRTTSDGEEYTAEYILHIDRDGTSREIFFNGGISTTMNSGRWRLDEDTLNLFNEPESNGFWWRLIGREEEPKHLTQWKILSTTSSSMTVQGYGVTLDFVELTTQREDDIRFLMEAWDEKRPPPP